MARATRTARAREELLSVRRLMYMRRTPAEQVSQDGGDWRSHLCGKALLEAGGLRWRLPASNTETYCTEDAKGPAISEGRDIMQNTSLCANFRSQQGSPDRPEWTLRSVPRLRMGILVAKRENTFHFAGEFSHFGLDLSGECFSSAGWLHAGHWRRRGRRGRIV